MVLRLVWIWGSVPCIMCQGEWWGALESFQARGGARPRTPLFKFASSCVYQPVPAFAFDVWLVCLGKTCNVTTRARAAPPEGFRPSKTPAWLAGLRFPTAVAFYTRFSAWMSPLLPWMPGEPLDPAMCLSCTWKAPKQKTTNAVPSATAHSEES